MDNDFKFNTLNQILETGTKDELNAFLADNELHIKDGKIFADDADVVNDLVGYWDKRQLVRKTNLNSTYGALLNAHCRFFDKRLGQSTTLTGRAIAYHMDAYTNECLTGQYDHMGECVIYGDTDSVSAESNINVKINGDTKDVMIEDLFIMGDTYWSDGGKEYSANSGITIAHYNGDSDIKYVNYNYVYRHKTTKRKFQITTQCGKDVIVTEDHSIMVLENGELKEKKPMDINKGDQVITIVVKAVIDYVESVVELDGFHDEYVYDIGVASGDPYFFGNDILVHNSVYFSAWPVIEPSVNDYGFKWDKDTAIELYDHIADEVNISFPIYMKDNHHAPQDKGEIIRCGREINAVSGIFIKKKRYAALVYDNEGSRADVNGKPGKVKAMGVEIKRSDTPADIQVFLADVLLSVLKGDEPEGIVTTIREFKNEYRQKSSWEKGTPKRVNNLTKFTKLLRDYNHNTINRARANIKKPLIPGHAMAAINYNSLCDMHGDNYSMRISDGMKTLVCKLKPNPMGYTSIGIPIDEKHIPQWFKELPFDDGAMEASVIDKKLNNLIGVLDWDLEDKIDTNSTFADVFDF
jgi:intein/homing endonuclease